MLPQVEVQESKVLPVVLTDRVVQAGAIGVKVSILAYNVSLRQRHTFKAIVAAPGSASARRVLKEELGTEWTYMDWNVG